MSNSMKRILTFYFAVVILVVPDIVPEQKRLYATYARGEPKHGQTQRGLVSSHHHHCHGSRRPRRTLYILKRASWTHSRYEFRVVAFSRLHNPINDSILM